MTINQVSIVEDGAPTGHAGPGGNAIIPGGVAGIGQEAFGVCLCPVVRAPEGSRAEPYAGESGIAFKAIRGKYAIGGSRVFLIEDGAPIRRAVPGGDAAVLDGVTEIGDRGRDEKG